MEMKRLTLAFDGGWLMAQASKLAPLIMMVVFDGELMVWLPWILSGTAANEALAGFPDTGAMEFASYW